MDKDYSLVDIENRTKEIYAEEVEKRLLHEGDVNWKDARGYTMEIMLEEFKNVPELELIGHIFDFLDEDTMFEIAQEIIDANNPHRNRLDEIGMSEKDFL